MNVFVTVGVGVNVGVAVDVFVAVAVGVLVGVLVGVAGAQLSVVMCRAQPPLMLPESELKSSRT